MRFDSRPKIIALFAVSVTKSGTIREAHDDLIDICALALLRKAWVHWKRAGRTSDGNAAKLVPLSIPLSFGIFVHSQFLILSFPPCLVLMR